MPAVSNEVLQSIVNFIKLTPLREIPKFQGRILDDNDLIDALEMVRLNLKDTKRMIGKPMYAGEKSFDFVEDAKRALEEVYLSSREQKDIMMQRRKHLIMYHLVIEPLIEDIGNMDHQLMIQCVDAYIDAVINYILTCDVEVHPDDATVMFEIVRAKIRQREERRKTTIRKRKTTKKSAELTIPTEDETPEHE